MTKTASESYEFSSDTLKHLLDYSSDEIFIFNKHQEIIYVNSACEQNYGVTKEELIGKSNTDLVKEKYWVPSSFPLVFKNKAPVYMTQTTKTGRELLTAAIPVLNEHNNIELIITTAREMKYYHLHTKQSDEITYNTPPENFIYQSTSFEKIITLAQRISKSDCNILIHGESGTGKGLLAKYIHETSRRKDENFLTINCGALPEELLESELFGYEKGAFTGADPRGKEGLLVSANNGTVFLDEIGEVSPAFQVKLLQVLQDKEFIPIGGNEKRKVNVRFIAATNRDLAKLVEEGTFREDLFYRLNVVDIEIPPLRKRKGDIEPLIYHFLEHFNEKYHSNKVISKQCLQVLLNYRWPGNVRQLENLMERLVIISDEVIEVDDLPENFLEMDTTNIQIDQPTSLNETLNETKKYLVRKSFKKYRTSRRVAEDLQVSQSTAARLIREYCEDLF